MKNKNKINICLACDNRYAPLAGVSIASFLKNANENEFINFYILDNNISSSNKKKIMSLRWIKNCNIEFIQVDKSKFENLYLPNKKGYLSISSYYRFVISDVCKNLDKILYVDCDVIATSSVSEFYNLDLNEKYVAVIKDTSCIENQRRLGFDENEIYFNSGVMLINLKQWRKKEISTQLFNKIHKGLDDQDILNIVLKGNKIIVDDKWNWQGKAKNYKAEIYPNLIHFITAYKPWVTGSKKGFNNEYFKALRLTPWDNAYEQLLRRFLPVFHKDRKYIHICFCGIKTRIRYN